MVPASSTISHSLLAALFGLIRMKWFGTLRWKMLMSVSTVLCGTKHIPDDGRERRFGAGLPGKVSPNDAGPSGEAGVNECDDDHRRRHQVTFGLSRRSAL